jgi:Putative bacterial sensory transduction regulator
LPDERVIEQVYGILGRNDITFTPHENKQSFFVPHGSAGVVIDFFDWGGSTVVNLHAAVLEQVDGSGKRTQKILEVMNEKNGSVAFARFHFDKEQGTINLEYHLLGDQLDSLELMNALSVIAQLADQVDDELRESIGSGVRAEDVWNLAQEDATKPGASGPVVEA